MLSACAGSRYKVIETDQGPYILDKKRAESYHISSDLPDSETIEDLEHQPLSF